MSKHRRLKLIRPARANAITWAKLVHETDWSSWKILPVLSSMTVGDREILFWSLQGRHLRVIIEPGVVFVERTCGAWSQCDRVSPGNLTEDGRPLDLIGLVRDGFDWLRQIERERRPL